MHVPVNMLLRTEDKRLQPAAATRWRPAAASDWPVALL